MNTPVASQAEIALQTLRNIDLNKVSPEGLGDAISQVISKSQEVLRLAQGLPPVQRAAIEALALQASLNVGSVLSTAHMEVTEEAKRKKEYEETLRLIQEGPQNTEIIKQQEEKLTKGFHSKEAFTAELVLTGKLTAEEAKDFAALSKVLDIPGIAKEFMPFEKKAALVKEVFTAEKAADFLKRDIEVNAVQQVLTGYADYGVDMPDLTKSMIDSFNNPEKNAQHIEDCDELQKGLESKRDRLKAANAGKEAEVVNKAIQENIRTKVVATTVVRKGAVNINITNLFGEFEAAQATAAKAELRHPSPNEVLGEESFMSWALRLLKENNRQRQIDTASVAKKAIEDILNGGANQQSKVEQEADKKSKTSPDRSI